ncbi:hypothetical protein AKJ16_DCAP25910, partial [Drosera capensis]
SPWLVGLGCWAAAQVHWAEEGPDALGGERPRCAGRRRPMDSGSRGRGLDALGRGRPRWAHGFRLKGELVMWMNSHIRGRLLRICVSRFTHIDHGETERVEYIYKEPITHQLRLLG